MKVIDILNKIANGEEVPEKINYMGDIYTYDEEILDYYDNDDVLLFDTHNNFILNEEVEIIEEDKKIEKVCRCDDYDMQDYGELYFPSKNEEILGRKINEIIDYIN